MHLHRRHTQRFPFNIGTLLLSFCLLLSTNSIALESDRIALIEIQSDSAEFNESNGTAIYRGQVELTQGTLSIKSASLTIFNGEKGVNKILAEGKPAYYQQQIEADKPAVKAEAKQIIYQPQQEIITLEGAAKLKQGQSLFEGDHINYDIKKHILNAKGSSNPSSSSSQTGKQPGRVKMVIPPTTQ